MIQSMTGFGDASTERDGTAYAVEIKSLNNRYFKPVIRLPDVLSSVEPRIESTLRNRLGRGTVYYTLKLRPAETDERALPTIDVDVLRSYVSQLAAAGLEPPAADRLLGLPGVVKVPQAEAADEQLPDADRLAIHKEVAATLTEGAIDRLIAARKVEGESLACDLKLHLGQMASHLAAVREKASSVIERYHDKLVSRVNELIAKAELSLDKTDLMREVAVFAERSDISEELARLSHHIEQFEEAIDLNAAMHVGRKLDFVAQEMLREANTIGSKAQDGDIAGRVIEMKGLIDRIKEQVQNVE